MLKLVNKVLILLIFSVFVLAVLAIAAVVLLLVPKLAHAMGAPSSLLGFGVIGVIVVVFVIASRGARYNARDLSPEIVDLFYTFARRHGLSVAVMPHDAYCIDAAGLLKQRLELLTVDDDEFYLSFGPLDFRCIYSPETRVEIEQALDAWIYGQARIVAYSGGGYTLETRTNEGWREFTAVNLGLFRGSPTECITNAT